MSYSSPPDPFIPNLYNSNDYFHNDTPLTIALGDIRYLQLTGGILSGNLFCSNGLSISGSFIIAGTLLSSTATQLNYLSGVINPGTAYASNALVLDSSSNINGINSLSATSLTATTLTGTISTAAQTNITSLGTLTNLVLSGSISSCTTFNSSGIMTLSNTTASTSISTGAIICDGGIGVVKNSYFGASQYMTSTTGALIIGTSTDTSRLISAQNSGLSTTSSIYGLCYGVASNTNNQVEHSFYYVGSGSTDNRYEIGFYGGNRLVSLLASGVLNINNPSLGASTGTVQIQSTGYALNLVNTSTYYTRLGTDSLGNFIIETNTSGGVGGYTENYFSSGSLGLGLTPRSRLDFGNTASDCIITLYQANNLSGTYMIGANSSANEYTSAGSNGHQFYYNSASGSTSPQQLGTNIFSMLGNGNAQSSLNLIATAGIHANGYSTTGLSSLGASAHVHYAGGMASFFGYNYSTASYEAASFNNVLYCSSSGELGVGSSSPTYPLDIQTSISGAFSGSYGYLSGSGSGTGTNTGSVGVSLRTTGRIFCSELDAQSDRKLKENIRDITEEEAIKFIHEVNPINYNMIKSKERSYGYIAQNVLKCRSNDGTPHLFEDLIELHKYHENIDEHIDEDGFISPKNYIFTLNYMKIIPIIHKFILVKDQQIKKNETEI